MSAEAWRPVKGYEGLYEVSDCGRVRSLDRYVEFQYPGCPESRKLSRGRILSPGKTSHGYRSVALYSAEEKRHHRVNRLVAAAFIPNPEGKSEVNHKDCDKANDYVSNLEWCTHSENAMHAVANGRCTANTNPNRSPLYNPSQGSKLILEEVRAIRRLYEAGMGQARIAEKFGVTQSNVSRICRNKAWIDYQHNTQQPPASGPKAVGEPLAT